MDHLRNKLNKLHGRIERRRKPTKAQRKKAYMHSCLVIREVAASMMPKTNNINYFLGVKWDNDHRMAEEQAEVLKVDKGRIVIRSPAHLEEKERVKAAEKVEVKTDETLKIQNNIRP